MASKHYFNTLETDAKVISFIKTKLKDQTAPLTFSSFMGHLGSLPKKLKTKICLNQKNILGFLNHYDNHFEVATDKGNVNVVLKTPPQDDLWLTVNRNSSIDASSSRKMHDSDRDDDGDSIKLTAHSKQQLTSFPCKENKYTDYVDNLFKPSCNTSAADLETFDSDDNEKSKWFDIDTPILDDSPEPIYKHKTPQIVVKQVKAHVNSKKGALSDVHGAEGIINALHDHQNNISKYGFIVMSKPYEGEKVYFGLPQNTQFKDFGLEKGIKVRFDAYLNCCEEPANGNKYRATKVWAGKGCTALEVPRSRRKDDGSPIENGHIGHNGHNDIKLSTQMDQVDILDWRVRNRSQKVNANITYSNITKGIETTLCDTTNLPSRTTKSTSFDCVPDYYISGDSKYTPTKLNIKKFSHVLRATTPPLPSLPPTISNEIVDHSKLEYINDPDDEVYISEDEDINTRIRETEEVTDLFPNEMVLANKKCKIFPKSRSYAIIRFGNDFMDRAIAIPKIIFHDGEPLTGEDMLDLVEWGKDGWMNARRDPSVIPSVEWKATFIWTEIRKPGGGNTAHHNNDEWRKLLRDYNEIGANVDISMKRLSVPTLKSVASQLHKDVIRPQVNCHSEVNYAFGDTSFSPSHVQILENQRSSMLEDISVNNRYFSKPLIKHKNLITVEKDKQYCCVANRVYKDSIEFLPIQIYDPHVQSEMRGNYSVVVERNRIYINGKCCSNLKSSLKSIIYLGESFNLICRLIFEEDIQDKYAEVEYAWKGAKPNDDEVDPNEDISESLDPIKSYKGENNDSLEPIEGYLPSSLLSNKPKEYNLPPIYSNLLGEIVKISQGFIHISPNNAIFRQNEHYLVINSDIHLMNGRPGSSFNDLRQSCLKQHDPIKFNLAEIDGRKVVLNAWEIGAQAPTNTNRKALEMVKLCEKSKIENQHGIVGLSLKATLQYLDQPTPPSDMSAIPISPTFFKKFD